MKKKGLNYYFIIIIVLVLSFTGNFILYNYILDKIKNAKQDGIDQVKEYEFESIWNQLELSILVANDQCKLVANSIESDIKSNMNLKELEETLNNRDDTNNPDNEYIKKLHSIIKDNIENVHFGNIKNNRNSMIVLEGNDLIIEDMFVDPSSRSKDITLDSNTNRYLSNYKNTTYNKKLFENAFHKLRTHSDQLIAVEPYNYISGDHIMINDMNYMNLKKVYTQEGLEGLRNYQFLVPIYITDTGDIFGNYDSVRGNPQVTHKFTIILTFNLYDQINSIDYDNGKQNEVNTIISRYDNILGLLYVFILLSVIIFVLMILTLISASNHVRYPHDKCVKK